ncbi:unnamed protein product [Hymenolepis diminuta]|uniref:Uncharacterized protein n=1 Tax=Hymenolepis diminuta TaxID=6216 RepID=A0A564YSQ3_HYMDI|nr:unnamed protein product [Hymenolepis diminuta]
MNVTQVTADSGDIQAVNKTVRFNDTVEVFQYQKAPKCLMLIQAKYVHLLEDEKDKRIYRSARLTGCTTRLNMSTTRRNKHGEICFIVNVEGNGEAELHRFKKLIHDKFSDILFTRA